MAKNLVIVESPAKTRTLNATTPTSIAPATPTTSRT